MIVGDFNQHIGIWASTELIAVQGLHNHVDFPTHQREGSLDPVLTDLTIDNVQCRPLDFMSTSDHLAILTTITLSQACEEYHSKTIRQWDHADWNAVIRALGELDWDAVFTGEPHQDVTTFTTTLLELQQEHVPQSTYITSPKDQPWYGYRCRVAAGSIIKDDQLKKQDFALSCVQDHETYCKMG